MTSAQQYGIKCPYCGHANDPSLIDCEQCFSPLPAAPPVAINAAGVVQQSVQTLVIQLHHIDPRTASEFNPTGEVITLPQTQNEGINVGITHQGLTNLNEAIHVDLRAWAEKYIYVDETTTPHNRHWGISSLQAVFIRRGNHLFVTRKSKRVRMAHWVYDEADPAEPFTSVEIAKDQEVQLNHGDCLVIGHVPFDDLSVQPHSPGSAQGVMMQIKFSLD